MAPPQVEAFNENYLHFTSLLSRVQNDGIVRIFIDGFCECVIRCTTVPILRKIYVVRRVWSADGAELVIKNDGVAGLRRRARWNPRLTKSRALSTLLLFIGPWAAPLASRVFFRRLAVRNTRQEYQHICFRCRSFDWWPRIWLVVAVRGSK